MIAMGSPERRTSANTMIDTTNSDTSDWSSAAERCSACTALRPPRGSPLSVTYS